MSLWATLLLLSLGLPGVNSVPAPASTSISLEGDQAPGDDGTPPATAVPPGSPLPSPSSSATSSISLEGDTAPGADGTPPATATPVSVVLVQDGTNITVTGSRENGIDSYLGIPFAEPPTGRLRFARPVPKHFNDNVLATVPGKMCPQPNAGWEWMDEDCLTLNVLVASENSTRIGNSTGTKSGLPVMVYIHGGVFSYGTSLAYIDPGLVQYGVKTGRPFVQVSLNYRLGVFGFPNGWEGADTNLGLWDQRLALEWIRDHIESFGGDPTKVSVFGQSAGAISIGMHMLNTSQDLFRAAILQSGAAGTGPSTPGIWADKYTAVARWAGCGDAEQASRATSNNTQSTLECLRTVTAVNLTLAAAKLSTQPGGLIPVPFAPVVDGEGGLIPRSPYDLISEGSVARIPFISGTMRDEGTLIASMMLAGTNTTSGSSGPSNSSLNSSGVAVSAATFTAAQFLEQHYPSLSAEARDRILEGYPDDAASGAIETTPPKFKQVAAVITDALFLTRSRLMRRSATEGVRTWGYQFAAGPRASQTHPAYLGYSHNDDLAYIFGPVNTTTHTAGDVALADTVRDHWINFAMYLDPNGQAGSESASTSAAAYWRQYAPEREVLHFTANGTSMVPDDTREEQSAVFFEDDVVRGTGW